MDKYAHQYKVPGQQTYQSRFRSHRMKEYVLTWGGLHNHAWLGEEVTGPPGGRGHSSYQKRAKPLKGKTWRVSQSSQGPNIKRFQCT